MTRSSPSSGLAVRRRTIMRKGHCDRWSSSGKSASDREAGQGRRTLRSSAVWLRPRSSRKARSSVFFKRCSQGPQVRFMRRSSPPRRKKNELNCYAHPHDQPRRPRGTPPVPLASGHRHGGCPLRLTGRMREKACTGLYATHAPTARR